MKRLAHSGLKSPFVFNLTIVTGFLLFLFQLLGKGGAQVAQAQGPIPGISDECGVINDSFAAQIETLGLASILKKIPNSGWVFVDPAQKFRSVTGEVSGKNVSAKVQYTDFPMIHDSHDFVHNVRVDAGQEDILSIANAPNEDDAEVANESELKPSTDIHVEWETGIQPDTHSGEGLAFFPKWAWPSEGDRVFVNGSWVFDCGHPTKVGDVWHYKTEIHAPRAIASMRQQFRTLPGTGTTPVQVTATDIYIHGRAGFVNDDLVCGPGVILDLAQLVDPCAPEPHRAFEIADDYQFDICLPPLLFDKAVPAVAVQEGPGNTVTDPTRAPNLDPDADDQIFEPSAGPCAADPAKFGPLMVTVKIPLADQNGVPHVNATDVYARKIYVGWVFPPDNPHHLQVTLNMMDLHDDKDTETLDPTSITSCECTFFFMNVDRAPDEWARLSDFDIPTDYDGSEFCPSHDNTMEAYDDDGGCGDGELNFSGPTYDFFVGNNQPFTVRARGYDQDCLDGFVGDHLGLLDPLTQLALVNCYVGVFPADPLGQCVAGVPPIVDVDECADNDPYGELAATYNPPAYSVGARDVTNSDGEFELLFTIADVPLTVEDTADLALTKDCKPNEPALAGVQFTCTILVQNPSGPGLPRDVVVEDTLLTDVDPADYTLEPPTFTFAGLTDMTDPCIDPAKNPIEDIPGGKEFTCNIGTVPIGGKAIITIKITSNEGGDFNNFARVSTSSTDPDLTNNTGQDSVHVTPVADLSITKSDSPDPLNAGTEIAYTLQVINHGPSTAVNVLVEDFLPAGVSIISVSGTGSSSCAFGVPGDSSRPTICTFDSLVPGATATMTIAVAVNIPGILPVAHNDARVSSDVLDTNNSNNLASQDTTIKVADLQIVKTSDADVYKPSSTIQYTVRVTNNGPAQAENVVVTDNLPNIKQAIYRFDTGSCVKSNLTLTCNLGAISPGGSKSFNIYVTVKGNKGQVTNKASVGSDTFDPNTTDNSSTRVVLIKGGIVAAEVRENQ